MNQALSLIFETTLSQTDVNPCYNRLLIPFKKLIRDDFLTPDETRILEEEEEDEEINNDEAMGVGAILVDHRNQKWGVILKRREVKKDIWTYALICGWNDIVKANGLKDGDYISLRVFRHRGILCFDLDPRLALS
ncbi:unnamed protein product [Thlaspi arvense]|uniref:TF-B3 domain-containing protein n=1 Tax=Thlaspi arvense TaxID=13288 RepID=A0AAU9RPP8_THLAR|nr:unnamed protein product [Thlaspi arvense]